MPDFAAPVTMVTINHKQFVCGLFWQPLTQLRGYMKEPRAIGKREGMDMVVIRRSSIVQAGFAAKTQGVSKGMVSLAAALARQLGRAWLGVFALADGRYALVAVNDGAVVPGCDMVGDFETVSRKMNTVRDYFNWEKVYAPAGFGHSSETLDLKTLLASTVLKKEYQLRQLAFGMTAKERMVAGAAVITLAALFSAAHWKMQQRRERQARIRAEQIEKQKRADLNAAAKQAQSTPVLKHPWVEMPALGDFLSKCLNIVNAMPLTINGWAFEKASCDGAQVRTIYQRGSHATINDLLAGVRRRFKTEPNFYDAGEHSAVQIELEPMHGGDDPLQPLALKLASFLSHFQAIDIKPKLVEKPNAINKPQLLPGQITSKAQLETKPDWQTFTFSFDTELAPQAAFAGLDSAGIRCIELGVKLQQNAAKLVWHLAGEVYAK